MVNRDVIAYLLHQLPEKDRDAFAERWMADPALYEQLRSAEADLLDGYARGEVSSADRALIEQHLLGSDTQRRKLAFAEALHVALPGARRRPVAWVPLAAAAALVAMSATAAWFWQQNDRLRREVAQLREQVRPSAPSGSVYAAAVPLSGVRGAERETRIAIPAGADVVRLEVELEPADANASYTATTSAGDQIIWIEEPVRPQKRGAAVVASVWIPAAVLLPGRYDIRLATGGRPIGYWPFTVATPSRAPRQ